MNPKSKRVRFLAMLVALLAVIGIWTHVYWLDGLPGALCELFIGRTTYGRDYTEKSFCQVSCGMQVQQVLSSLGEPVKKRQLGDSGEEIWYYTWPKILDDDGVGGNCCYTERYLRFSNGVVSLKHHEFFFD